MADVQKTIEIVFGAVDKTGGTIKDVGDQISGFADGVGKVTGPLAGIADKILSTTATISAMGVAFAAVAINETSKFEDSLYLVEKQLGGTGVEIDEARIKIEELGLAYGTNANEVARSLAGFLAAGYDYQTGASLVETSTRLMIAGELDAQFATTALNASLSGFKITGTDAAEGAIRIGDALNKIGDISSGKFEEIVQGFSRLAPTAKDAGLSIEQTAAMVAVLVDKFGSGEIAATALKSGFVTLIDPSKEAREELARLGVATTDLSTGQLRPIIDVLGDLASKTSEMTSLQGLQTAAVIFGKDQAGALNAVLSDWAKYQSYVAQEMDKTTGAAGSMAREVEQKLALISTATDRARESWRQFIENVGAEIVDDGSYKTLIDNISGLGQAFKDIVTSGAFDELTKYLQRQFASIAEDIAKVAENLPAAFEGLDWSGLIGSFEELSKSFDGMFEGVDLTTVDGLKKALQTVIDTGETLVRLSAGIVAGLTPMVQGFAAIVKEINASEEASKAWAGEILGWAKSLNLILPAISALGGGIGAVGVGLQALAGAQVVSLFTGLATSATGLGATLAGLATGPIAAAIAAIAGIGYAIYANYDAYGDYKEQIDRTAAANENIVAVSGKVEDALADLNAKLGTSFSSMQEFNEAANSGAIVFDKLTNQWVKAEGASDGLVEGIAKGESALTDLSKSVDQYIEDTKKQEEATVTLADVLKTESDAWDKVNQWAQDAIDKKRGYTEVIGETTGAVVRFNEEGKAYTVVIDNATGAVTEFNQVGDIFAKKEEKKQDEIKKSVLELESYKTKMEEIASNERIKTIEAKVQLDIAGLETDMERVKAAFSSIDNSISSTGDLLGSLFGNLLDAESFSDKWLIEDQIAKENELRQQSFDLQKELAEAEIARIEAQVRAMDKGDAAITIEGTGLEPELEAFMWKILEKIRVRANAEFSDYLLGIGAA